MMSKPKMYLDIETMENVFKDKFPPIKVSKKEKDEPVRLAFISTRDYEVDAYINSSLFDKYSGLASSACSPKKVTMCQCILICDSSIKVYLISTGGEYEKTDVIDLENGSYENAAELAEEILMQFTIQRPSGSDEPGYRGMSITAFRMLHYEGFAGKIASCNNQNKINVEEYLIRKDAYFTIKDITRTIFNNIGYNSGNPCLVGEVKITGRQTRYETTDKVNPGLIRIQEGTLDPTVTSQINDSSKEFVDKFNAEKEQKDKETWKRLRDLT